METSEQDKKPRRAETSRESGVQYAVGIVFHGLPSLRHTDSVTLVSPKPSLPVCTRAKNAAKKCHSANSSTQRDAATIESAATTAMALAFREGHAHGRKEQRASYREKLKQHGKGNRDERRRRVPHQHQRHGAEQREVVGLGLVRVEQHAVSQPRIFTSASRMEAAVASKCVPRRTEPRTRPMI
ncbi:hypothetical protein FGB62_131g031 [Gracilaria domingensis]|nr:hypothetical protein FGB62_377g00 [Gracilaria domingensis]KAI0557866.1 hypothetical protein FGB62_255g09 [Gracilaria domingensis]KAI0559898.1 hypothetical protein FGB62_131g031 [Gracilaria domingensis]